MWQCLVGYFLQTPVHFLGRTVSKSSQGNLGLEMVAKVQWCCHRIEADPQEPAWWDQDLDSNCGFQSCLSLWDHWSKLHIPQAQRLWVIKVWILYSSSWLLIALKCRFIFIFIFIWEMSCHAPFKLADGSDIILIFTQSWRLIWVWNGWVVNRVTS